MAFGVHKITEQFEQEVAKYTGAPYAVALDNCSNALFLALVWYNNHYVTSDHIEIPSHTYMSAPCEIIHAGFRVKFIDSPEHLTGAYQLYPSPVWDCALRFTSGMYQPGTYQCLSFTGPYKHLKLSKGGMILTDNADAAVWFKKARFSGRHECSYHEDNFDMIGWNFYMMPELAARGLLLMSGMPKHNPDLTIKYPDLSKYDCYKQ